MKLEVGYVDIKDIQFGAQAEVRGGVLYVNEDAVKEIVLADGRIAEVELDIARPGESVRIAPVKDVIEPRTKICNDCNIFPGVLGKVKTVGAGRTHVLKGAAVVTCGQIVGFQEGIIDMTGLGAKYTPFSATNNLVLVFTPKEGLEPHDYEQALRMAGLKVAAYLGDLAKEVTPDRVETYETLPPLKSKEKYPDLPRVAYVKMLQTQGLLHDTYVYGVDMKQSLSTMLHPTEVMDGAIISGNCVSACDKNTTYHHLNNPVIHDLFEEHGKSLVFAGMVITNENVYLMDKERSSDWAAKLVQMMDVDGVIITQEGFGNPDTDLMMNCKKIEALGIPTVIITDEYAGRDGTSQSLADVDVAANAVVTGGNANEVVTLPKLDRVIGSLKEVDVIAGGFENNTLEDGSIVVELQAIIGATNEMGFNKMSAR
ncbi:MAG: glycine/sarcosine/betaine reductase component B subunit [Clostridiales bacterium]|jgi:glycine reductase|nr:glycine/sarcosine/betaine reductase component B subunit [Clostridiales bacterium]